MEKVRRAALQQLKEKVVQCLLKGIDVLDIEDCIKSEVAVALMLGIPHKEIGATIDEAILEAASVA